MILLLGPVQLLGYLGMRLLIAAAGNCSVSIMGCIYFCMSPLVWRMSEVNMADKRSSGIRL